MCFWGRNKRRRVKFDTSIKEAMDKAPIDQINHAKFDVLEVSLKKEKMTTPPPTCELEPPPPYLIYGILGDMRITRDCQFYTQWYFSWKPSLYSQHQSVIGHTIDNLMGVIHVLCMHQIHLDDDQTFFIKPQRRINPNMKEVVKKQVLKLLEGGYSTLYQIVGALVPSKLFQKKCGMIVIKNKKRWTHLHKVVHQIAYCWYLNNVPND